MNRRQRFVLVVVAGFTAVEIVGSSSFWVDIFVAAITSLVVSVFIYPDPPKGGE